MAEADIDYDAVLNEALGESVCIGDANADPAPEPTDPSLVKEPQYFDDPEPVPGSEEPEPPPPPGHLSYEDWIAQGKDPSDYKGENAYKSEYERIQEIKELKSDSKEMKKHMQTLVEMAQQQKDEAYQASWPSANHNYFISI